MNPIAKLIREPLLHFLLLGALLFMIYLFSQEPREQTIVISQDTRDFLLQQAQSASLETLGRAQSQAVLERYVDEEILYREALRLGLTGSPRIRQQLIDAMRLELAQNVVLPREEELRSFYEERKADFASTPLYSFRQRVFTTGAVAADDVLERLQDAVPGQLLPEEVPVVQAEFSASTAQLVSSFGRLQSAEIVSINDENWHGPYQSLGQDHYLQLVGHRESTVPDFAEASRWLEQEWLQAASQAQVDDALRALRDDYEIEIFQVPD